MTTFTTNTEFAVQSRKIAATRDVAMAHARHLIGALVTRRAIDPDAEIARAERREAARRAVDTLLR